MAPGFVGLRILKVFRGQKSDHFEVLRFFLHYKKKGGEVLRKFIFTQECEVNVSIGIDADNLTEAKTILSLAVSELPEVSVTYQPIDYFITCEPNIEDEVIATYTFQKIKKMISMQEVITERTFKDV